MNANPTSPKKRAEHGFVETDDVRVERNPHIDERR
jgi:hypothetical protein